MVGTLRVSRGNYSSSCVTTACSDEWWWWLGSHAALIPTPLRLDSSSSLLTAYSSFLGPLSSGQLSQPARYMS